MNLITDTWRQLVRRKLWPVALLLIGALVAVPAVLAKKPEIAPAPSHNPNKVEGLPATFVSAVEETAEQTERRRVLGEQKDPFEPAPVKKAKASKKKTKKSSGDEKAAKKSGDKAEDTKQPSGGSAPKPDSSPPVSPAPTAAPTETIPQHSIKVRFGTSDKDDLPTKTVQKLSVLPDDENPVLVYRGVEDGFAIFEITGSVEAQGDGVCAPTPEDCQYLKLRAGETQFITVTETGEDTDAQYQLDLVKIYKKATKVPAGTVEDDQD